MSTVGVDEKRKVDSWRLLVLLEAGYAMPHAEKLAASSADLHEAVKILRGVEENPNYQKRQKEQRSKLAFQVVY